MMFTYKLARRLAHSRFGLTASVTLVSGRLQLWGAHRANRLGPSRQCCRYRDRPEERDRRG